MTEAFYLSACLFVWLSARVQWTRQRFSSVVHINAALLWFIDLILIFSVHRGHSSNAGLLVSFWLFSSFFFNRYKRTTAPEGALLLFVWCVWFNLPWDCMYSLKLNVFKISDKPEKNKIKILGHIWVHLNILSTDALMCFSMWREVSIQHENNCNTIWR